MKLKRKILPRKPNLDASDMRMYVTPEAKVWSAVEHNAFVRDYAARQEKNAFGCIREWFIKLFEVEPPEDQSLELIKLKVQYELLKRDHDTNKAQLSPRVRQNYEASKKYRVLELTEGLKQMVLVALKIQEENTEMKVKKASSGNGSTAVASKAKTAHGGTTKPRAAVTQALKEKRETVTQSYLRLFTANHKAKQSDVQLAKEMHRLHPDKKSYTSKDISAVRSLYNNGRLAGQGKKPAIALEGFNGEK